MDIKLIHKLDKDNVVPYLLSHKEEYQGEMHWENIKIFRPMFLEESDLERKNTCDVCGRSLGTKLF
jgi:hypothetical protein